MIGGGNLSMNDGKNDRVVVTIVSNYGSNAWCLMLTEEETRTLAVLIDSLTTKTPDSKMS